MTTLDLDTPLPDDIESAHRLIRELLVSLHQQAYLNEKLQHQLEKLLRRLDGKKSEKLDPNQPLLFAREILEAGGSEITPEPQPPSPSPAKPPVPGHGRKPLPASLPRASGSCTTSRSSSGLAPTAARSVGPSPRRSASNSNMSPRH
jgi:hypothetical protein